MIQGEAGACKHQAQQDRDALAAAHEQAMKKLQLALGVAQRRVADLEEELARLQAALEAVTAQCDSRGRELAAHGRELQVQHLI
jgi:predicted  nucleic acid-binding Zn-ribbon protein